jgi:hypothetical protein
VLLLLCLRAMQEHLRQQPAVLSYILRSLFEIILFENPKTTNNTCVCL